MSNQDKKRQIKNKIKKAEKDLDSYNKTLEVLNQELNKANKQAEEIMSKKYGKI